MWSSLGTKKMPGINNLVTMGITGLPLLKGPTASFSSFAPFPAKTFANPNFVNKNHPRRHNSQNSFPEPSNYSEDDEKVTGKQDDRQETVPEETEQKKMSNTKKRRKKRSRKGKKKEHGPTVRQLCKQSMEIDISEEENVDSGEETEIPSIHSRTIDIMSLVPEQKVAVAVSYTSTESVMPKQLFRSRVPSLCESEDSFIVFDDNIEDDTDSDENLQSGSDVEESSDTAIDLPIKKVSSDGQNISGNVLKCNCLLSVTFQWLIPLWSGGITDKEFFYQVMASNTLITWIIGQVLSEYQ